MALTDTQAALIQAQIPGIFDELVSRFGPTVVHAVALGAKSEGVWDETLYVYASGSLTGVDNPWRVTLGEPEFIDLKVVVIRSPPFLFLAAPSPSPGRCVVEPQAQGGDCIAVQGGEAGTLGARFHIGNLNRFITATHVLNDRGRIPQPVGLSVVHPYNDSNVIGAVVNTVPWQSKMRTDGGLCSVRRDDDGNPHVLPGIGGVTPPGHLKASGGYVTVSGFAGGVNRAKINAVGGTATVYDILNQPHTFTEVFFTPRMCRPGDSGALALDDDSMVVGMAFAQNDVSTMFSDILEIFDELKVDPAKVKWD